MKKKNKLYAFAAVLVAVLTMLFASPTETKAAEFSDRLVTEVCLGYNSYEESEEAKTYYLKNSHGDIIGQVDENGNLLASYSYNAFGELVAAVAFGPETSISSFLYAGEQYDAASGLYYLRARHYDVGIGRFTQEDTCLGDGRNLYAYTHSNPLKYTDPSGHASYSCLDDEADPFDERLNEIGGGSNANTSGNSLRQTADQKALLDLAKGAANSAKNGNKISAAEATILDSWAVEYNVTQHHQSYAGSGEHFPGGNYSDHTHIYNVHVPYEEDLR